MPAARSGRGLCSPTDHDQAKRPARLGRDLQATALEQIWSKSDVDDDEPGPGATQSLLACPERLPAIGCLDRHQPSDIEIGRKPPRPETEHVPRAADPEDEPMCNGSCCQHLPERGMPLDFVNAGVG